MSDFDKGGKNFEMFGDFYRLCKKYWEPTEADRSDQGFWDQMISDFRKFMNRHGTVGDETLIRLSAVIITRADDIARNNTIICEAKSVKMVEALLKAVS